MKRVTAMYFSPTGTGRRITEAIAGQIGSELKLNVNIVDLTEAEARKREYAFLESDILVFGYPVYGGRVPNVLQEVIHSLRGSGTLAVAVAVYGNRAYEDALIEAQDVLTENGFLVIGAGAFIGEHSYSNKVAAGRPDEKDLLAASDFGSQMSEKVKAEKFEKIAVKGDRPYKESMKAMPFVPKTAETCTSCGLCCAACPMKAISKADPGDISQGCILCGACIKLCPEKAKYIDAEPIQKIRKMLETKCMDRKEPELFT